MITSKDNEKLKLIRRVATRKGREQEGLFVTEGEDLLDAGLGSGAEPAFVLAAAESGIDGEQVEPKLLDRASALGSGTRVVAAWPIPAGVAATNWGPRCVYLHGVADPGNVGTIVRTAHALAEGAVVLGPGCADPYGPKAVRATMGSVFAKPIAVGAPDAFEDLPRPRIALSAHGGSPIDAAAGAGGESVTLCAGAERAGLPDEVERACEQRATIALRPGGAESLNVAAAVAIALQRICSGAVEVVDREPER